MRHILFRFPKVFLGAGASIGLLGAILLSYRYWEQADLLRHSEQRVGVIESTTLRRGARGSYVSQASVVFTVEDGGQKFKKRFRLPPRQEDVVQVGDSVTVFVLDKDPVKSRVDTTLSHEKESVVAPVGVMVSFGVCFLLYSLWEKRRLRRLDELKKLTEPNQALQTTPMTRSGSEKTIVLGRPQRGV